MSSGSFQLPDNDIRAQEMVFWLKRLSLEIPVAISPEVNFHPIVVMLESQAKRLASLESLLEGQSVVLDQQSKQLADYSMILKDIKGYLVRYDSMSRDPAKSIHQDPRYNSEYMRILTPDSQISDSTINRTQKDSVPDLDGRIHRIYKEDTRKASPGAKRSPMNVKQRTEQSGAPERRGRANGRKRRLLSINATSEDTYVASSDRDITLLRCHVKGKCESQY